MLSKDVTRGLLTQFTAVVPTLKTSARQMAHGRLAALSGGSIRKEEADPINRSIAYAAKLDERSADLAKKLDGLSKDARESQDGTLGVMNQLMLGNFESARKRFMRLSADPEQVDGMVRFITTLNFGPSVKLDTSAWALKFASENASDTMKRALRMSSIWFGRVEQRKAVEKLTSEPLTSLESSIMLANAGVTSTSTPNFTDIAELMTMSQDESPLYAVGIRLLLTCPQEQFNGLFKEAKVA